jgi:hypothetical protein
MSAEGRIVEIGRQTHPETIKTELAADMSRFLEIHAERPLRGHQLDEGTAMFGDDNALTGAAAASAKRALAPRIERSMAYPAAPSLMVGRPRNIRRRRFVITM